jgi:DNA invertase Pin-like site-specific DNA recombinase
MATIIYTRVSTQEQADSGAGLNAQLDACRAFAMLKGWGVSAEYQDAGVSGTADVEKRTGLMTAIGELRKGDVLLVAKRDRIGRDVMLVKTIERMVAKRKASIHALNGSNEATPEGALMNTLMDGFAAYEVAVIRARTKAALGAKKARGERMGKIPFGFMADSDGVHVVPCEHEQGILRMIANFRNDGYSLQRIANALNNKSMFNRQGNPWNPVLLHTICKDLDQRLAA